MKISQEICHKFHDFVDFTSKRKEIAIVVVVVGFEKIEHTEKTINETEKYDKQLIEEIEKAFTVVLLPVAGMPQIGNVVLFDGQF